MTSTTTSLRRVAAAALLLGLAAWWAAWPVPTAVAAPLGDPVAGDETSAMSKALRERRPIEVSPLTTDRSRVTADPASGRFVAQLNANPVRVRRGTGWAALDPDLRLSGGRLVPGASEVDLSVGGGGTAPLVTIADGADTFALRWPEALPAPVVCGDKAVYVDVRPGIDLVVQTNAYGFSQYLVVRDRAAARDPLLDGFSFDVDAAPGLDVREAGGGIEVRRGSTVVFAAPRLQMWGSTGPVPTSSPADASSWVTGDMEHGPTADVDLGVGGGHLRLRPDRALLDDPRTAYPVVIDPSVSRVQKSWAMVWSNGMHFWNPDDDDHTARVGYDGWSGQNKKSRVFYTFDTRALRGKTVSSATFTHKQVHSPGHDCGQKHGGPPVSLHRSGTISSSTTWPGPKASDFLDDSTVVAGAITVCHHVTTQEWDATDGAHDAAKNRWDTLTLRLASHDESDRWGWRQYQNTTAYPVLSISYNTPPAVPGAVGIEGLRTYGGVSYLSSRTPRLSVTVKDPDAGDGVRGVFVVNPLDAAGRLDDRRFLYSARVGNPGAGGKTVTTTVPGGVLVDGRSYAVDVRADDGHVSTVAGPTTRFTVDASPPGAPVVTGPSGPVPQGAKVAFSIDAPEADVAAYRFGLNSGTASTTVTPTSLGGKVVVPLLARQFGPSFLTVASVDRAGNVTGSPRRFEFTVDGSSPSDRYHLDGVGADDRTGTANGSTGSDLVLPAVPPTTWVSGRDAFGGDGTTPLDCSDRALQVGPGSGSRFISTRPAHPLDTAQSFTASAWLRPDDLSTTSADLGERYAVTMPVSGSSVAFSLGYRKDPGSGQPYWLFTLDDATDRLGRLWVQATAGGASAAVAPQRWTHVAGVYDAAARTGRLYVDGRLIASRAMTFTPSRGSTLTLGAGGYGTSSLTWNGAIDEVVLHQGALDANQVGELVRVHRTSAGC